MFEMDLKEKVRPMAEVTPKRVLELTMDFSDAGYELVEARRRAWHKYTWENSELHNLTEKPKVLAIHGN